MTDDFVNTAERAAPIGLVGTEENKRRGADKGRQMRDGSIICNEGLAGGEEVDEFFSREVRDRETEGIGKFGSRICPVGGGDNCKLNLRRNLSGEFDETIERPFRSSSVI